MTALPPLALTMGEPAGVGGELTLAAWNGRAEAALPPFFVIDDPERLTALAERLGLTIPIREITAPEHATEAFADGLPVLRQSLAVPSRPGTLDARNAGAVISALDRAIDLVLAGRAGAVVTNPIHKKTLLDAGFRHAGHTDYLAERAGLATPPVMMLAGADLRVVPVTVHVPLRHAIDMLTRDLIVTIARITHRGLVDDFGIARPRLAVAGLNPHAGEDGALGIEDRDIVAPAVEALRAEGIDARGPLPADTLFHADARAGYDAALGMYHDQALIPLKTLDFHGGVNITLGLPFVRTSPDHGTALDIAGTGRAVPTSLVNALKQGFKLATCRHAAATRH